MKILYFTDRYGVSSGYMPAFKRLLSQAGIRRNQVFITDIYNGVPDPLTRKTKLSKTFILHSEKVAEVRRVMATKVNAIKPTGIVVSDPAVLGALMPDDLDVATLAKQRGAVLSYTPQDGTEIPVVVTLPITAIHRNVEAGLVASDRFDAEELGEGLEPPYQVKKGAVILNWDWQKAGRVFSGREKNLPPFSYSVCRTRADLDFAYKFLSSSILIAADIETAHFPPTQTCVGYCGLHPDGTAHTYVIPYLDEFGEDGQHWQDEEDHEYAYLTARKINALPILKTMQNGNYDCSYFIRDRQPVKDYLLDSMLLWYSLFPEMDKGLGFISSVLIDRHEYWKEDIKGDKVEKIGNRAQTSERYWRYNAKDCYTTLFCTTALLDIWMESKAMQYNYLDVLARAYSGLGMSMRGVKADFDRRFWHKKNLTKTYRENEVELRFMLADNEFNINSAPQKKSLLHDVLGVPARTAKGKLIGNGSKQKPSAGAVPLRIAKETNPIFSRVLSTLESAMGANKQISNVCNVFYRTDRIRTSFKAAGTETGRYASSGSAFWDGTNIQNIRKEYRDWFVADENHVLLDIDYSQSDDVFMAYESQDPEKIRIINAGLDAHAVNGEMFFRTPYDEIVAGKEAQDPRIVHPTKGIRQISKRVVHGSNFLMAAFTLYITMGKESVVAAAVLAGHMDAVNWDEHRLIKFCGVMMNQYRKKYYRLSDKEFYREVKMMLRSNNGKLTTCWGLQRQFMGDLKDNATQREAIAYLGQGGTAGNMNRVQREIELGYIQRDFRDAPNPCYGETPLQMSYASHGIAFLMQVHDNFVCGLNLKNPLWKEACNNLLHVMNRPVIIKGAEVRIKAEAEIGLRWGKGLIDWDGNVDSLEERLEILKEKERNLYDISK